VHGGPMLEVRSKLEQCRTWLQNWDRGKYGNIGKLVEKKTKILAKMQMEEMEVNQEAIK
jgi:hypothetical protein